MADRTHQTYIRKAAVRDRQHNQTPINNKEADMESNQSRQPWNKGKLVGQQLPLKPKDIWAIRIHLQNEH
jgi:hypothetical protein